MGPRIKRCFIPLFFILACTLLAFCFPELIRIYRFPSVLRIAPGQAVQYNLKKPFAFYLPAERPEELLGFNGEEKLPSGIGGSCGTVSLNPQREGVAFMELRFLGITLKKVNLRVVNMPEVAPGGDAVGVLMAEYGVLVVGHLPVKDEDGKERYPAREADIRVGDLLVAINGCLVHRPEEVDLLVQALSKEGKSLRLTVIRDGVRRESLVYPVKRSSPSEGAGREIFLLGLYIEDPAAGVGTLTYFNPKTHRFGALGHRIMGFGDQEIPLVQGKLVAARITGISQGDRGEPGEKIGIFAGRADLIGDIEANTALGIFGTLATGVVNKYTRPTIKVATASEVEVGPAEILTVLSGDQIRGFDVQILRVYHQTDLKDKGLIIKVTDPILLAETGGIVQGMSGSPIIQKGKLVGAVTHVFVNDPTRGYGVFAEWMIQMEESLEMASEKRAS